MTETSAKIIINKQMNSVSFTKQIGGKKQEICIMQKNLLYTFCYRNTSLVSRVGTLQDFFNDNVGIPIDRITRIRKLIQSWHRSHELFLLHAHRPTSVIIISNGFMSM